MIRLYSMLKWCAILTAVVLLSSSTMDNKSAVDDVISPTETISTRDVYKSSVVEDLPAKVHAVTDLSHHFSFYADNRFHTQYLPNHKGVTNWCNLFNVDFSNANLLILLGCDDRIEYLEKDIETINNFLKDGGGVVIFGSENSQSQNKLLKTFGAEFNALTKHPLKPSAKVAQIEIEGAGGSSLVFDNKDNWEVLISDANQNAVMARTNVGAGTLLISSRSLAGSNPNAKDSINKEIWRPLLEEVASGKIIEPNKRLRGLGIGNLEHTDDHGTFKLSYNDYMQPFADAMVDVYKRSLPYIENRMGVSLSPGMASTITLLATDGGGFSSGTVVALAVWWGGFPDKEGGMIEFLTHESVHSWVLPFAEVWNEPIATYVGNLVMIDMGHEEEALRTIANNINRATKHDPDMNQYDIQGNLTGNGKELSDGEKNDIHWGKTYWIFEELRKENPNFMADYFQLKRKHAAPDKITKYDMNNTVGILSMAMGRDLYDWFNEHGIVVDKNKAEIKMKL